MVFSGDSDAVAGLEATCKVIMNRAGQSLPDRQRDIGSFYGKDLENLPAVRYE